MSKGRNKASSHLFTATCCLKLVSPHPQIFPPYSQPLPTVGPHSCFPAPFPLLLPPPSYATSPQLDEAPTLSPCLPFPFPFQHTQTLLKSHHPPEPLSAPLASPCRGQPGVHADGEPMAKWKRMSRKAPFPFDLQSSSNLSHTTPSQGRQLVWKGACIPSLHPKTDQGLRPPTNLQHPKAGNNTGEPQQPFLWNH